MGHRQAPTDPTPTPGSRPVGQAPVVGEVAAAFPTSWDTVYRAVRMAVLLDGGCRARRPCGAGAPPLPHHEPLLEGARRSRRGGGPEAGRRGQGAGAQEQPLAPAQAIGASRSAEQGHVVAQSSLGVMYRDGRGATQDDEAVGWLRRAADQGDVWAQYNLGSDARERPGTPPTAPGAASGVLTAAGCAAGCGTSPTPPSKIAQASRRPRSSRISPGTASTWWESMRRSSSVGAGARFPRPSSGWRGPCSAREDVVQFEHQSLEHGRCQAPAAAETCRCARAPVSLPMDGDGLGDGIDNPVLGAPRACRTARAGTRGPGRPSMASEFRSRGRVLPARSPR